MDLLAAQGGLSSASDYVGEAAKCQRTWRAICDLMLRFDGKTPTLQLRKHYQGVHLGRIPGNTLLSELLPYPRERTGSSWPYRQWQRFDSFKRYKAAMLPSRIALLKAALAEHDRTLVVCYGRSYWDEYSKLVDVREPRRPLQTVPGVAE
jgi:hypothetical protein